VIFNFYFCDVDNGDNGDDDDDLLTHGDDAECLSLKWYLAQFFFLYKSSVFANKEGRERKR
jgi:hypothetical protein